MKQKSVFLLIIFFISSVCRGSVFAVDEGVWNVSLDNTSLSDSLLTEDGHLQFGETINQDNAANPQIITHGFLVDTGTLAGTDDGDSGGPVYFQQNGVNKLIGFISDGYGTKTYNGAQVYRYTVVARGITALNAFGASLYTGS